jgi:hypothetical protein
LNPPNPPSVRHCFTVHRIQAYTFKVSVNSEEISALSGLLLGRNVA